MPSPDITPYVDLTLNDKDPQDIFDAAIEVLQGNLPEWSPREGNTEVMLLEALAMEVAELIFSLNRVPGAIVEVFLKLYGIERDIGQQPTVDLRFFMAGTQGYTIPAGVSVRLDLAGGLEPVVFTTQADVTVNPGDSEAVAPAAIGDRYTADANAVPAGTLVELLDSVLYVDRVELDTVVANGRDPEEDEDYFDRGVQRFTRLSDTLVLPRHFVASALEEPYCLRAFALDNYTPDNDPDNNGPVGNDPGHLTLAVYGDNEVLDATDKQALLDKFTPDKLANLAVHIIDPTIDPVDVTVTVQADAGYDAASVITNVTTAITDYLDPMTWDWSTIVRRNELIQVIGSADGVAYVADMTTPAADINLAGVAPLADANTINVTVNLS